MKDDTTKPNRRTTFAVRVSEEERANIDQLRERTGAAYLPPGAVMTDRLLLMIALERLTAHLAKLEKGRARGKASSHREIEQ